LLTAAATHAPEKSIGAIADGGRQLKPDWNNHAARTVISNRFFCKMAVTKKADCALLVCTIGMGCAIAKLAAMPTCPTFLPFPPSGQTA
jgi:hypothetical protein